MRQRIGNSLNPLTLNSAITPFKNSEDQNYTVSVKQTPGACWKGYVLDSFIVPAAGPGTTQAIYLLLKLKDSPDRPPKTDTTDISKDAEIERLKAELEFLKESTKALLIGKT